MQNVARSLLMELVRAACFDVGRTIVAPDVPADVWMDMVEGAERNGLAPLLYTFLSRQAWRSKMPSASVDRLKLAYIRSKIASDYAYPELAHIQSALAAQGIGVILLKGCALAPWLYQERAHRPLGDLDLLVERERIGEARRELERMGYADTAEMGAGFQERFWGEHTLLRGGRHPSQVDLHWHPLTGAYYRARVPAEWFWEHTHEIEIDGVRSLILTPPAQILYLCAHMVLHRPTRLVWSLDVALLLARYASCVDREELVRRAEQFRLVLPLAKGLAQCKVDWNAELPVGVEARLSSYQPDRLERIMFAASTGEETRAHAAMDGLAVPGFAHKLDYWLSQLFPPPAYMRTRYRITHDGLLPLFYVRRIVGSLYHVTRSTWSLMSR